LADEIRVTTHLDARDVCDNAIRGFARDGWELLEERHGWVLLGKGPHGGMGCIWLVLFFPIGLAYLFTGWGKRKLWIRALESPQGLSDVEISWQNANRSDKSDARDFARWLEEQPAYDQDDLADDVSPRARPPVRRRRRASGP
jgi:hypothetical protein